MFTPVVLNSSSTLEWPGRYKNTDAWYLQRFWFKCQWDLGMSLPCFLQFFYFSIIPHLKPICDNVKNSQVPFTQLPPNIIILDLFKGQLQIWFFWGPNDSRLFPKYKEFPSISTEQLLKFRMLTGGPFLLQPDRFLSVVPITSCMAKKTQHQGGDFFNGTMVTPMCSWNWIHTCL